MRRPAPLAFLRLPLTVLLTLSCSFVHNQALATGAHSDPTVTGHFYSKRPSTGIVLPTGCARGYGPQYRSFDPKFGRILKISGDTFVVFETVSTCAAAANICSSQLSGTSCCKNACLQQHSGRTVGNVTIKYGVARFADGKYDPTGIGAVFDPSGYRQCEAGCARVPTVHNQVLTANPFGTRPRTVRTKR